MNYCISEEIFGKAHALVLATRSWRLSWADTVDFCKPGQVYKSLIPNFGDLIITTIVVIVGICQKLCTFLKFCSKENNLTVSFT